MNIGEKRGWLYNHSSTLVCKSGSFSGKSYCHWESHNETVVTIFGKTDDIVIGKVFDEIKSALFDICERLS